MGVLSSIGIGSATVDLVLPADRLPAGETVDAHVDVEGGTDDQTVDEIYFALRTRYHTDESIHTVTVSEFALEDGFTIGAGEERTFDVTVEVPPYTPTTIFGGTKVWIDTGLDIDWANDPEDKDEVAVEPHPAVRALHDATGQLGFELRSAKAVAAGGTGVGTDRRYVQEFEYRPVEEPYRSDLEELEVAVDPGAEAVDVALEVDLPDTMLSEREHRSTLTVESTDADAVAERVADAVDQYR